MQLDTTNAVRYAKQRCCINRFRRQQRKVAREVARAPAPERRGAPSFEQVSREHINNKCKTKNDGRIDDAWRKGRPDRRQKCFASCAAMLLSINVRRRPKRYEIPRNACKHRHAVTTTSSCHEHQHHVFTIEIQWFATEPLCLSRFAYLLFIKLTG